MLSSLVLVLLTQAIACTPGETSLVYTKPASASPKATLLTTALTFSS